MFDHLQYKGPRVVFKGPTGEQVDEILDLNDEDSVKYREFILGMIAALENDEREANESIEGLMRKMIEFPVRQAEFLREKAGLDAELIQIRSYLARLSV